VAVGIGPSGCASRTAEGELTPSSEGRRAKVELAGNERRLGFDLERFRPVGPEGPLQA
jgi:hypothetical protein